jgi:hypothetical protein
MTANNIMYKLLVPLLVVGALWVNPSQAVEAEVRNERDGRVTVRESEHGSDANRIKFFATFMLFANDVK